MESSPTKAFAQTSRLRGPQRSGWADRVESDHVLKALSASPVTLEHAQLRRRELLGEFAANDMQRQREQLRGELEAKTREIGSLQQEHAAAQGRVQQLYERCQAAEKSAVQEGMARENYQQQLKRQAGELEEARE